MNEQPKYAWVVGAQSTTITFSCGYFPRRRDPFASRRVAEFAPKSKRHERG